MTEKTVKATLLLITPKSGAPDNYHIKVGEQIISNMMVLGVRLDESSVGRREDRIWVDMTMKRSDMEFSHGDDWEHGSTVRSDDPAYTFTNTDIDDLLNAIDVYRASMGFALSVGGAKREYQRINKRLDRLVELLNKMKKEGAA